MNKTWDKNSDDLLKEWYCPEDTKLISEILERSISSIQHRASKLGITNSKAWKLEEDNILYKYYELEGLNYCAKLILTRTKIAVENRISKLGLKHWSKWTEEDFCLLKNNYGILSIKELAKTLNRSEAAIMRKGTKHNLCLKHKNITKETLINDLIKFKPKGKRECDSNKDMHSVATYTDRFGSWNNALKAAGLPINIVGSPSVGELELLDFIESIYKDNIIGSDKTILKGLELDIVLPDLKLAFEFNGIYWHSSAHKDKNYHINKTKKAQEAGYKLVHIYESDWLYKQDIVKSRIINLLKLNNNSIYARKCKIRELEVDECRKFLDSTHLQGFIGASIKLGLFYNEDLVSVQTYGKPRYSSLANWELLRFSNKLNTSVVGAASKLFKYFIKNYNPSSIISYSLLDWGYKAVYDTLGFEFLHDTKPNYSYLINNKLESRLKYQKHKLKDILVSFDEIKTEEQNMLDNGYYRLYNCGSQAFIWKLKEGKHGII
jgi:hypothetical protein